MKKERKEVLDFCQSHGLTIEQFYGSEKYSGYLDLDSLTSIPEGFNPTVGSSLYLRSLTSIPKGFNPTVGGSLDLRSLTSIPEGFNPIVEGYLRLDSLTSIPEGFNPTVGGYLYLNSLTSIPKGFNPTVGGFLVLCSLTSIPEGFNPTVGSSLYLRSLVKKPANWEKSDYENKDVNFLEWKGKDKTYILADSRFSEVISKKGNVWKLKDVSKDGEYYLVTDGSKFAHGTTIKEAKADLVYKIGKRDTSVYVGIDVDKKFSFEYCVEMYRVITGSCGAGVRNFIENKGLYGKSFSVRDIIEVTNGSYGNDVFVNFFK